MRVPFQRSLQNGFSFSLRDFNVRLRKRVLSAPLWTVQPETCQFDTTNRKCVLDCEYCNPQSVFIGERGDLPLHVMDHVAEVLSKGTFGLYAAYPFMNSDPLLEGRLPVITRLLKKRLKCLLMVSTNGVVFRNRFLLRDRLLNDVAFTVSASNSSLYLKVHGKPCFGEALKTFGWFSRNKFWSQRLQARFILYGRNFGDLENWRRLFSGFSQEVRPLHYSLERETSLKLGRERNVLLQSFYEEQQRMFERFERPCNCFHNLAVGFDGRLMQCCDLPYSYSLGHVEEIDVLEAYRKRLDRGLDVPGCRSCNQKNRNWRLLFEKYVWS